MNPRSASTDVLREPRSRIPIEVRRCSDLVDAAIEELRSDPDRRSIWGPLLGYSDSWDARTETATYQFPEVATLTITTRSITMRPAGGRPVREISFSTKGDDSADEALRGEVRDWLEAELVAWRLSLDQPHQGSGPSTTPSACS